MKKIKAYLLLFVTFSLCLTVGLAGCKNNEDDSNDSPANNETPWQDENVDNDGWT